MRVVSRLILALGVCILIAVSLLLNALFGYTRGHTHVTGILIALVSVGIDLVKTSSSQRMTTVHSFKSKALWVCVIFCCALWSFTASIGLYLNTRDVQLTRASDYTHRIKDIKQEIRTLTIELSQIQRLESPRIIEAKIQALLQSTTYYKRRYYTLAERSKGCTRQSSRTRKACAKISLLKTQLAAAQTRSADVKRLRHLKGELLKLQKQTVQTDRLTQLATTYIGISAHSWNLFLAVVLAITIELITSIGPYHAFQRSLRTSTDEVEAPDVTADPGQFIAQHTKRTKGARVSAQSLYKYYLTVCATQSLKPLTTTAFGRWMTNAGYRRMKSSGVNVYLDLTISELQH